MPALIQLIVKDLDISLKYVRVYKNSLLSLEKFMITNKNEQFSSETSTLASHVTGCYIINRQLMELQSSISSYCLQTISSKPSIRSNKWRKEKLKNLYTRLINILQQLRDIKKIN